MVGPPRVYHAVGNGDKSAVIRKRKKNVSNESVCCLFVQIEPRLANGNLVGQGRTFGENLEPNFDRFVEMGNRPRRGTWRRSHLGFTSGMNGLRLQKVEDVQDFLRHVYGQRKKLMLQ